ncbi:NeuD/PglB/VioB family sugar acetyltransferase [Georgenia thermotolerans]|uniref:Sugar acetyltransferase n=1 Tax=Georgenia thermotolerans TaxID=527326 RepID=A0A7J5US09_9MICO|nr:NeuD/PglB/VioB family sugar acetyltransferase [Georgenia thermotolerans]KAE8765245.1 sugar acetyltransferase [Georgenia thermotolerans]
MSATPLVIVGMGGLGREVIDVVEAINAAERDERYELLGMLDDAPRPENLDLLADRRVAYLGTCADWLRRAKDAVYVVGIADAGVRRAIDQEFSAAGFQATTLVHPAATLGSPVTAGPGSIVCAGARLTTNISLGRHVHVHVNATVGHDSVLADYASAYPLSAISGSCRIGPRATVGAHAVVLQGLQVGAGAFVGAGAVVTRDVPRFTTVVGVPAK